MKNTRKKMKKSEVKDYYQKLHEKKRKLREEAEALGIKFHGRREESIEDVGNRGLRRRRTREGYTVFGNAEIADTEVYSSGKKWSAVHSIPENYLEEQEKKGKMVGNDYYAGFHEKHALFDIPAKKIKTFITNIVRGRSGFKEDPIMRHEENELNKKGLTTKKRFEEPLGRTFHKINYYNSILTEEDYKKHKEALQRQVKQTINKEGKVSYSKIREATEKLGIPKDRQDEVIARVFLDLNLKKTRGGFK